MYIAFIITNNQILDTVYDIFSPVNDVIHVQSPAVFLDYVTNMYGIGQSRGQSIVELKFA